MLNFDFYSPARIIFGKDTEQQIGKLLKSHAKKVLLHYGGGSIKQSGLYDRVVASLNDHGIEFVELAGVKPNPRLSLGSRRHRAMQKRECRPDPGSRRRQRHRLGQGDCHGCLL